MKLDKNTILRIRDCYSGLGELTQDLPFHLDFPHCPGWRNYVMSPNFLLKSRLTVQDLKTLEDYFASHPAKARNEGRSPRIICFADRFYDLKSIRDVTEKRNWIVQEKSQRLIMNFWNQPRPVQIPKGYYYKVARYFEKAINKDFRLMMKLNFQANAVFMTDLERMLKKVEKSVLCVVIYNSNSKPVAAGLVSTGQRGSLLFCGSVAKAYRKKGLWNQLVAIRQSNSNSGSNHLWITTTQNQNIKYKGDFSKEVLVYYRPSTD